jgi:hypothetical protein
MMRPSCRDIPPLLFLAGIVLAAPAGCSSFPNPWADNHPPTEASDAKPIGCDPWARRVIVLGRLENPARSPLRWRDIGPGMSDALAGMLINRGDFDVWSDASLARSVQSIVSGPFEQRSARLAQLTEDYPQVRYLVTGQVTDFYHSSDLSQEVQRSSMSGRQKKAVVAIRLNIIDLQTGRIVATDHVRGTAPTSDTPTKELYANVAFGSYMFWNTPLGEASEQALEAAADTLRNRVPRADAFIRIVKQISPRKVNLSIGGNEKLAPGQAFYVCLRDAATGELTPVIDPDTARPLQARIESSRRGSATAWLLGLKPLETNLRGAVLCRDLPPPAAMLAGEAAGDAPPPGDG